MARTDHRFEIQDGQNDFRGGMVLVGDAPPNAYRYSENIIVRNGWVETRPGMTRTSRWTQEGFFFNEEGAKTNDATHTGFWFPFDFVNYNIGSIQGSAYYRFLGDKNYEQVVVAEGRVYRFISGFLYVLSTEEAISSDEEIEFVQANQELIMLRGDNLSPMKWDGSDNGFVLFGTGSPESVVNSPTGAYAGGRLWLANNRDDVYVSDIFDTDSYDYVGQLFSVQKGDGDEIVRILPYLDDYLLVFKKRSVYSVSGVTFAGTQAQYDLGGTTFVDGLSVRQVFSDFGLVAPKAVVSHGEQVTFLSYRGIVSISRTNEGKLRGLDVTLSAPIQPIIDRINWTWVDKAAAGSFNNYLFFSVPLDGSTTNNAVLVYDMEIQAWVSVWTGNLISVAEFFNIEEKFETLNNDGQFRQWFVDDPWDSNDLSADAPAYDNSKIYAVGDIVEYPDGSIYQAIAEVPAETTPSAPLYDPSIGTKATTFWTEITTTGTAFPVESFINTRYYKHQSQVSPKRFSRTQILFRHQNPKITVDIRDREYETDTNLFTDVTYSQTAYDVDNKADWVSTNINEDFQTEGRQDYSLFLDANGIYISEASPVAVGIDTTHDLRFIPRVPNNNEFSLKITNTQGKLKIISVVSKAQQSQMAKRNM